MNLKEQRAAALRSARAIIDGVKAANRDVTDSEEATITALFQTIDGLDVTLEKARKSQEVMRKIAGLGGPGYQDDDDQPDFFGDEQGEGFLRAARSKGSYGTVVNFKAATVSGGLVPTSGSTVVPMPPGLGAFPLRNLFTPAEAEGPTVRYYRMGAGTAAVVAEAGLKPDSGVTTTAVDASLQKIACLFQISDELSQDAPFLLAAIQREATLGTLVQENQQIIAALLGASGIVTTTGLATAALDVVATAVGVAEATNGLTPAALILHPADLANLRKLKANTSGDYYVDPLASGPATVHGVPLVSSAATAVGVMLLLSPGCGVFYSRGGLRIDSGYNADDWSKNLITYRVEERILAAIVRPGLVTRVTLT